MAKLKTGAMHTTKVGQGNWRLHYDEDGNVVAFELWAWDPALRGHIKSYKAFEIIQVA